MRIIRGSKVASGRLAVLEENLELAKLIDFLHQYPVWYRSVVVIWVVIGAILAGGLLVLRLDPRPDQAVGAAAPHTTVQSPTVPSSAPVAHSPLPPIPLGEALPSTPPSEPLTPQTYFRVLSSLSDRFLEKHEFVERNAGRTVDWEGLVHSVSQQSSNISMQLTVEGVQPERTVFVYLPESLRTKAFSLQKGDLVRVKGKLALPIPSMPDLDAVELVLVRPRSVS